MVFCIIVYCGILKTSHSAGILWHPSRLLPQKLLLIQGAPVARSHYEFCRTMLTMKIMVVVMMMVVVTMVMMLTTTMVMAVVIMLTILIATCCSHRGFCKRRLPLTLSVLRICSGQYHSSLEAKVFFFFNFQLQNFKLAVSVETRMLR